MEFILSLFLTQKNSGSSQFHIQVNQCHSIHYHYYLLLLFLPEHYYLLIPNLTFYLIALGLHRTFSKGAECQQRTLTPPDTWSCPTLGHASVLLLRPCLVSGLFSSEHPSVFPFYHIPKIRTLGFILVRCILLKLRHDGEQRVCYLDLLLRSETQIKFILPLKTKVTILISILQNFCFLVAIFQLRSPMAFIVCNLYDVSGLACFSNVFPVLEPSIFPLNTRICHWSLLEKLW